ncbi:hypothetical protein JANAI62_03150 [Jannaschia pagri]|uniref:Bacteriocin-protection, YdeI or OmpD-Associated n=1 Tax=Jannaschia pagri TaxID=2829797 RepID=A0ABQ4NGZ8_9RHOB|nr:MULTISPECIES: YdeI/OmpD-associated family protein [unclassified Jannaschia]GIT90202.1 hypothetical protein JANAI61_06600 [Jannaschia sp. AI_61]GIT93692.1 hypothetical protein JANAI62_03150 [Jannaschia sp. AI_62]
MTDWVTFEGQFRPLEWGRSTYTILRLPDDVMAALGQPKRVEGEIGDHPVNLAPTRAPVVDEAFLWAGKAFLDASGLQPGEVVSVRLRPADPNVVEVPPELSIALRAADKTSAWEALSPGKRRGLLHRIETAKRPATRDKRIAEVLGALDR